MNLQFQEYYYVKVKALIRQEWDTKKWDIGVCVNSYKNKHLDFLILLSLICRNKLSSLEEHGLPLPEEPTTIKGIADYPKDYALHLSQLLEIN